MHGYANGSLHIGHINALLPGDVLARYFRAKGDTVFCFRSDCHGTPVAIRAKKKQNAAGNQRLLSQRVYGLFFTSRFSYDMYGKHPAPSIKAL